ncbi:MAG TPA: sigma-70 family RNA polymerase sigma factor [Bryobacteraceae bacterium]|nr:sigma-70 family RNA polymerase sigma factor [Bryobacteraceae bacterium]
MELSGPISAPSGTERDALLATLRERIVAFAASRVARDAAEDLAQEVLLVLHERYPEVERLEELLPLCFRILRFKLMAFYRKAGRRGEQVPLEDVPLADGAVSPELCAERQEISERLAAAIRQIGPRCKELLRLKLAGRTFPEIQAVFGAKSINTIYTWDFRCRKHLLELMGGSWTRPR